MNSVKVRFLAIQVKLGVITIDNIPEKYSADVKKELGIEETVSEETVSENEAISEEV